jgi:quercetin dioxygenase-like cupin family protein
MSREPFTLKPLNYPKPHSVVGIDITVLVSREATGSHEITLQTGDKGSGPPPHSHPWDESFYVVKGAVDFTVEGKTTKAAPEPFSISRLVPFTHFVYRKTAPR